MNNEPENTSSTATTDGLEIHVEASYLPQHSCQESNRFAYGYKVHFTNQTSEPVTVCARHWEVIDAEGNVEQLNGEGVVGQCPTIGPGETYDYHSFTCIKTSWGTMEGHYTIRNQKGKTFRALVGRFFLLNKQPVKTKATHA